MFRRSSAVEQLTVNQLVVGSIPTVGAKLPQKLRKCDSRPSAQYTADRLPPPTAPLKVLPNILRNLSSDSCYGMDFLDATFWFGPRRARGLRHKFRDAVAG